MDDCAVSGTVCLSELSQFQSNVGQVGPGFNLAEIPAIDRFVPGLQTGWTILWGKYSAIFFLLFQKENENLSISFLRFKLFGHFCIPVNQQIQIWTFYSLDVN